MTKELIIQPTEGLCNYLRVLIFAQYYAKLSKRHLRLIWLKSHVLFCDFSDLFENKIDRLDDIRELNDSAIVKSYGEDPSIYFSDAKIIYMVTSGLRYAPGKREIVWQKAAENFNKLTPVKNIRETVTFFRKKYFSAHMLGVHIRRGDLAYYRKVKEREGHASMDSRFEHEIDLYLDKHRNARIFLATDEGAPECLREPYVHKSSALVERYKRTYKNRIVIYPKRTLARNTKEGIQDALIDLMLLNHTNFLIGTHESAFSKLATMRNVSRVKDGNIDKCRKLIK